MNSPFGATFAPTNDNADKARRGEVSNAPRGAEPVSVLNFKLKPSVAGAPGGVSPLQGQNQLGPYASAVVQSVLRTVFGGDVGGRVSVPGLQPGADLGSSDPPNFTGQFDQGKGATVRPHDSGMGTLAAAMMQPPSATPNPVVRIGQDAPFGGPSTPAPESPFSGSAPEPSAAPWWQDKYNDANGGYGT